MAEKARTDSVVVLTGAGISRESGLDTFRDAGGIWQKANIEEVATPEGFAADPVKVHGFYNGLRNDLASGKVNPNPAHVALAELEHAWKGEFLLVTQNVDDLHERAGSRNLVHMHGELLKGRCLDCGEVLPWPGEMTVDSVCPKCGFQGKIRPHIVWFGEVPLEMPRIHHALANCRIFIAIGTSGNVYPAAGFVERAKEIGNAHTVELNLEPSKGATLFDEKIYGPASQVVPAYVKRKLA